MNAAIPTPFDILDPPAGPLTPPTLAWLILFFVTLLAALVAVRRNRRTSVGSIHKLMGALLDEVKRAEAGELSGASLQRVVRLAKRIIAPHASSDPSGLSPAEIRDLAISMSRSVNELERSASNILERIAHIDELTYAPANSSSARRELVTRLITDLESHLRRHPLP